MIGEHGSGWPVTHTRAGLHNADVRTSLKGPTQLRIGRTLQPAEAWVRDLGHPSGRPLGSPSLGGPCVFRPFQPRSPCSLAFRPRWARRSTRLA